MDGRGTVNRFDGFRTEHARKCGALELEVSHERFISETRFVLCCPVCQGSITGSIPDSELAAIVEFLAPVVH